MLFSGFVFAHISTFSVCGGFQVKRAAEQDVEVLRLPSFHQKDFGKELLQLLGGSISVELPLELVRRGAGGILLLLTGLRHQLRL